MAEEQKNQSLPSNTQTPSPEIGTPSAHQTLLSETANTHPTPRSRIATIHPTPPLETSFRPMNIMFHVSSAAHLCITGQQKVILKLIEKKRNELYEEESRLEKDGNHIIILLAFMLSLYMLVFGGGIAINGGTIIAYITSKKNENTLIMMVVATICTYVAGLGMPIFLAFRNLQRLSRKNTIIQQQRGNLKAESQAFRRELNIVSVGIEIGDISGVSNISVTSSRVTLESAKTRIKACIDSLGSDCFYHGHMFYMISIGVIGAVFLGIIVTLLVFSYTEHKVSDLVKLGQPSLSSLI